MKYILTYQLNTISTEVLEAIDKLNTRYRKQPELGLTEDRRIRLYRHFLPKDKQPFHLLLDKNNQVMHLESDVIDKTAFKIALEKESLQLETPQINFRIAQNFAWAGQLIESTKQGNQSNAKAKPTALLYVYELSDESYQLLNKVCKDTFTQLKTSSELAILKQKQVSVDYKLKQHYSVPELPNGSKLIGLFNPTTGPKNKCIVFNQKLTGEALSEGEQLFIEAATTALLGYVPNPDNALGVSSYNTFTTPVVNLSNNVMQTYLSSDAQVFKKGMIATAVYVPKKSLKQAVDKKEIDKSERPEKNLYPSLPKIR
jgi:hypothetical protein